MGLVKRIDAEAFMETVQIFPGNPADKGEFTLTFPLHSALPPLVTLRERLKAYRQDFGLYGEEVDRMAGVALGTCSRIETGRNVPTWSTVEKLACALYVDPNFLLWGEARSLAERLADLRIEKGFSQNGLARESGVKQSIINGIERGRIRHPSEKTMRRLAMALSVRLEELCPGGIPWRRL